MCGPGLVSKPLLHRVGISRAPLIESGCHLGNDTPHCGASTDIYVREPIAWGVVGTPTGGRGRWHLCGQLGVHETTSDIF